MSVNLSISPEILCYMGIETGTATLSKARSGALQLYIKKDIAEKIDLPLGKDLKITWNSETKTINVNEL